MRLILYVFILSLFALSAVFLYHNPGNIELSYQDWVIDMPLWVPVMGAIGLLFVLTVVYSFFSGIFKAYRKFREWLAGSTLRAVTKNANQAWVAMAEGDWARAEAGMLKAAKHGDYPLHYYLTAAKAAQEMNALDRRDSYLHSASKVDPEGRLAVGLVQAELQIKQGQYDPALATLQDLQKNAPHNNIILKLLSEVFAFKEEWREIIKLSPQLKKYSVLPAEDISNLEIKAYGAILSSEAKKAPKQETFIDFWDSLPKNTKHNPAIIYEYAKQLLELGADNEAEQVIRNALKKEWDIKLVELYGLAVGADISKQINTAETWLRNHQSEPELLLTLSRLCLAHKLWGKARSYLEASLAIKSNPDAYAELGRLLGFLGEQQKSLDCYRKGLMECASVLQIDNIHK